MNRTLELLFREKENQGKEFYVFEVKFKIINFKLNAYFESVNQYMPIHIDSLSQSYKDKIEEALSDEKQEDK